MVQDLIDTGKVTFYYRHEVDTVNFNPGQVGVKGTFNGQRFDFKADAIVLSVSIGVLKSGDIKFTPDFPDWKKNALKNYEMGLLDKVFVSVPKTATWLPKTRYFGVAIEKQGYYPYWINWG